MTECAICQRVFVRLRRHHAVYQQHLRSLDCNPHDPDNFLVLCDDCHERHHNRSAVVPLTALRDENIAYAFKTLGPRAYDYLLRYYGGDDERLNVALLESTPTRTQGQMVDDAEADRQAARDGYNPNR